MMNERPLRVNHQIRIPFVRLVKDGKQLGTVSVDEARKLAFSMNLDLVEIAPNERPPVCRIMDYGKFKYEQQKKQVRVKSAEWKEVRFSPVIAEHDVSVKISQIGRFLEKGTSVKIVLRFKGRQLAHIEEGKAIMDKVLKSIESVGRVESTPKMDGKSLIAIVSPSK